jgi:hypothetical protein
MGALIGGLDYPDPMPWLCGCCASLSGLFLVILAVTGIVCYIRRDRPSQDP